MNMEQYKYMSINSVGRLIEFLHTKINKQDTYCHVAMCTDRNFNIFDKTTSFGINSSRKRFKNDNITTHAEIQAMNNLKYKLSRHRIRKIKVNLIVLRFLKNGCLSCSAPCYHCTTEISKNKCIEINNLYYSTDNGIAKMKFDDWMKNESKCISKGWKHAITNRCKK